MISIDRTDTPEILATHGKALQRKLCAAYTRNVDDYDLGLRKFKFERKIYAAESVKQALLKMQYDKCCYCESKISHIAYGDVEHYRPKAGYQQTPSDALQKPGYYWLAYEWDNLLISCQICNQRYKKNHFPLLKSEARAHTHRDNINHELALLINPASTNPVQYIAFREEIPYAIDGNPFGIATIQILALDRTELNERRRDKLQLIKTMNMIIRLAMATPDNQDLQIVAENASQQITHAVLKQTEFSAASRFFAGHFGGY